MCKLVTCVTCKLCLQRIKGQVKIVEDTTDLWDQIVVQPKSYQYCSRKGWVDFQDIWQENHLIGRKTQQRTGHQKVITLEMCLVDSWLTPTHPGRWWRGHGSGQVQTAPVQGREPKEGQVSCLGWMGLSPMTQSEGYYESPSCRATANDILA